MVAIPIALGVVRLYPFGSSWLPPVAVRITREPEGLSVVDPPGMGPVARRTRRRHQQRTRSGSKCGNANESHAHPPFHGVSRPIPEKPSGTAVNGCAMVI